VSILFLHLGLSDDYLGVTASLIETMQDCLQAMEIHFIEKLSLLRLSSSGSSSFREKNTKERLEELGFSTAVVTDFLEEIGDLSSEDLLVNMGLDLLQRLVTRSDELQGYQPYPFSGPTDCPFSRNPSVHRNRWSAKNLTVYNVSYTSWQGDTGVLANYVQGVLKERHGTEQLHYYCPTSHSDSKDIIRLGVIPARASRDPPQNDFSDHDGRYLFDDCRIATYWAVKRYGDKPLARYGCILVFKKSNTDDVCAKYHGVQFCCSNSVDKSTNSKATLLNISQWLRYVRFCRSERGDIDQGGRESGREAEVEKWFRSDYIIGPRSKNIARWEEEGYTSRRLVPDPACSLLCIKSKMLGAELVTKELMHAFYFADENTSLGLIPGWFKSDELITDSV
jgi:hypothetical protein